MNIFNLFRRKSDTTLLHEIPKPVVDEKPKLVFDTSFADSVRAAYDAKGWVFDPITFTASRFAAPHDVAGLLPLTHRIVGAGSFGFDAETIMPSFRIRRMMQRDGVQFVERKEDQP